MKLGKHTKFILTPLFKILEDCVNATKSISTGIESYPLCDYIMQTTFLKMTGASEQKLKCILWEIATNDFDFRYNFLKDKNGYGECSSMDDKNKVFKNLIDEVKMICDNKDCLKKIFDLSVKEKIQEKAGQELIKLFENSIVSIWQGKQFIIFKKQYKKFLENHFCNFQNNNISLLEKDPIDYREIVWKHRNSCAHYLKSYQMNLPDLSTLIGQRYDYENYFFRFSILILLDEIFIKLYSKYLDLLEDII